MKRQKRLLRTKSPGNKRIKIPAPKNRKYFKVRMFVDQYLVDLNAVKAYQRCGLGSKSYDADRVEAHKKLNDPEVQQAIWEEIERRRANIKVTQERVLQELASLAFSNIKDISEWKDNVIETKDSGELDNFQSAAIQEISETKQGLKIKMHDKKGALVDLGKHLGLFWDADGKVKDPTEEANNIRRALREIEEKTNGSKKK
jgi:phage terminase small subunit